MDDKASKESVDYSRGMMHSHCGPILLDDKWYCKHFVLKVRDKSFKEGACTEVAGPINPTYWCKKYEKK